MKRSIVFILSAVASVATAQTATQSNAQNAEAVLQANRLAAGATGGQGTLQLRYKYAGDGLKGVAEQRIDLASGNYVDSIAAEPASEAHGFDGTTPWMRDISGATVTQEGGDRVALAINQAYRNANLWWRSDRGGATIESLGRESIDHRYLDHLAVTPLGGKRFDAWFDVDTHLLARTAEPQLFFKTQTTYGAYRRVSHVMVAGTQEFDSGTGPAGVQTFKLRRAVFLAARPASEYARPTALPSGGELAAGVSSVTLPFRLLNNHIYVEGRINGKGPYTFIVDTGGHTLVSPRVAKEVGLHPVGASVASGAGEKTAMSGFASYEEIALGDARLRNQTAFVTDIYDRSIEGIPVDGMVGFELFRRFAIKIDYGAQTMTITDPARFDATGAGTAIAFKFYDHLPFVEGFIDDVPARFDVDTGSRSEIDITSPFVASHQLRGKFNKGVSTIAGWGVGGPARSYVVRMPSLTIGGVRMDNVVAGLSESKSGSGSDANYDGNIGSGFLKRFVVTFDYAHQIMYLKPLDPQPVDAGRFDRSGLWMNATDAGYVVMSVAAPSPAADAGLAENDVITAIDGDPAAPERLSDARILLRARDAGTRVNVSFIRGGVERSTVMILRDQI